VRHAGVVERLRKNRLKYPIGTVLYENDARPPLCHGSPATANWSPFSITISEARDYSLCVVGLKPAENKCSRGGWRAVGR